jgi:ABC-type glycerol-3-phosphate transport system substrate-binding protein
MLAAPYVRGAYAAGKLTLGTWDHWVPGANDTFTKILKEWGEKNKVDVSIDYITSQGEKDKLTAAAEAQAGTGHDIMSHRDWNIRIHSRVLEPLDDVVNALIKQYGPISPVAEYLAKDKGTWRGVPTAIGSQVKPCQSRLDLYKQHAGIDLQDIFPADESKYDKAKTDKWTWDTYLESAQKLHKAGFPVGIPMGQASDAVDTVGAIFNAYGVVMVDAKDNIKVNSDETRVALEYMKKLMAVNPPEVYAWDDAGNNRWIISGKGSAIMNPPSSWAVAKRDNPKVAEQLWIHGMPKGPKGRFVGQLPQFYGLWSFSKNKSAAKDLLLHISQKEQIAKLVEASVGYDLEDRRSADRHSVHLSAARRRADLDVRCAGARRGRCPDVQPGHQHRDGGEGYAGQREDRRGHQVGREGTRRHAARLIESAQDKRHAGLVGRHASLLICQ